MLNFVEVVLSGTLPKVLRHNSDYSYVYITRLFLASKGYHHSLTKKKDNLALDDPEKLLPLDTLGIVMITHGEEFGGDSEFGTHRGCFAI